MPKPGALIPRAVGAAALLLFLMAALLSFDTQAAQAETAANLHWVSVGGNYVYNYDFLSKSARANNADWPITILFTGNATVDKAKNRMDAWSNKFDSTDYKKMNALMAASSTSSRVWDDDAGKKTELCPHVGNSATHYRVYNAVSGQRLYNRQIGYWLPASTHRDYSECNRFGLPSYSSRFHCCSEEVEQLMIDIAHTHTSGRRDVWNLQNAEPYRVEGNHRWNDNGYASTIGIT